MTVADGTLSSESLQKYAAEWQGQIVGEARRKARALRHWVREDVWSREEVTRSAYYNEYCVPAGFRDSAGMSVGAKDGEQLVLYIAARRSGQFAPGGREAHMLELLQPALESGARALALRSVPGRLLDAVDAPTAIFNLQGRLLYASKAFLKMIGRSEDESTLWQQAGRLAIDATAHHFAARRQRVSFAPPRSRWQSGDGALTLCATLWESSAVFNAPVCLVTIERVTTPMTAARLASLWSLTSREAEVALQLADGVRNRDIAQSLGISEHTARRHTEQVFQKLGVHSRGEVSRVVTGGRAIRG